MAAKTRERITIPVGGMHCASCVCKVQMVLGDVPGVAEDQVISEFLELYELANK